ncbi:MAG TPA: winged helix-turn-helix domain-containing protein [Terracidiphilus sp.]|jgi:DNA-binding winged helix-turn-helix (wHTH) protein/Tol biopolymer transport system component
MTERKCFVFKFADVEVREREFLLTKAGERIPVEPKAFRVLLFLLRNPGRLIPKDEIVGSIWNDSAVSDNSLTRSIAQLRRVLGDDSREPLYILTVPTVGYRFLCEVTSEQDGFGMGTVSPRIQPNGTASEPLSEPKRLDDLGSRDQFTTEGASPPNPEKKPPEALSSKTARSNRVLFAGLAAASLLILFTGFLIWWAVGKKAVPDRRAIAYPLIEQRITSNPPDDPIRGAIVSPDGKYVAYADPTGLYLRQMPTGETRPWSLPKGFVAWPNSWFPDSTHLLAVRIEAQAQRPDLWKASLYKLSLLGGDPQKIMDDAAAGSVSPDGLRIAYLPGPKIGSELWVMDSDGANTRKVVSAGVLDKPGSQGSWFFPPVWSPAGKRLACIEGYVVIGSDPQVPTASLMTIDPNGGGPKEVLSDSRFGQALWWARDGRILFAYREDPSIKKNDDGVYSIRIDDRTGKADGPPQQITQAEGSIRWLSETADGRRLVLWRSSEPSESFIATYDARTHQFKEPRRLTLDENENFASAWTSDSKAILFASNRNGTWKLFKQGIEETTPEALVEAPSIVLPRLSPDGLQVLYLSTSRTDSASGATSLMSKPITGGPPHQVLQEPAIVNYGCARAPSKLCVFSKLIGQNLIFVSFDPNDVRGRELLTMRADLNNYNWVISPDGSKLAIVLDAHRIRFLSLSNGGASDVIVKDWPLDSVDWSADSQTVFMPSVTPKGIPVILEVDQTGKAHVVFQGVANTGLEAMIQSPDRQYGLLLEVTPVANNVWMVDNF